MKTMMNSTFKELGQVFSSRLEGLTVQLWTESIVMGLNIHRPVSELKEIPVSGDVLAGHRKGWRKFDE